MKKRIISIISLVLATVMLLCACSGAGSDKVVTTAPAVTLPEADKPKSSSVITFCDSELNSEFLTANDRVDLEVVDDRSQSTAIKLTLRDGNKSLRPSVRLQYGKYMELCGLEGIDWKDCRVAVFFIKLEGTYDAQLKVSAQGKSSKGIYNASGNGTHREDRLTWQYVTVPLVESEDDGKLHELMINFLENADEGSALYIKSISFVKDSQEALKLMGLAPSSRIKSTKTEVIIPGMENEYKFIHLTDLHMCAISAEDKSSMRPVRYTYAFQRRKDFKHDLLYSEERIYGFYEYAKKLDSDLMIMTGDILDFPSKANVSLLYDAVESSDIPTLFALGNHDWSFKDDYHTSYATKNNIPLFADLGGGDPLFSYVEYEDLIVASIDNSRDYVLDETVDKFLALYEKNKPIILTLHVPFYSAKLAEHCVKVSGKNLTMGGEGMHTDKEAVNRLYQAVCVDEDTPVVAVFAGHLHYNFEDNLENGVPQYLTWQGYVGGCRIITVKGEQ